MIFDNVAEFHNAFSLPIFDTPTPPDASLKALRIALLQEEIEELTEAYENNDIVEIADALADITYIICGTLHSYGLVLENKWEPDYYQAGDLLISPLLQNKLVILDLLFKSYVACEEHSHVEGIVNGLYGMLDEAASMANMCGIPFETIFEEVHRSNMSKLLPDGSVLRREDGKVLKSDQYSPANIKAILFPDG